MRSKTVVMAIAAGLFTCSSAFSQENGDDEVEYFIITGSPLEQTAAETTATVATVDRDEITEAGAVTLGELLARQPGIHQSSFAAGASRPIIRGLDNFRVRVQENGVGSHDASALSEDHGVSIDPLAAQRIEVVRGPATLRYGSEAIGGVVNVINNRIPDAAPEGGYDVEAFGMYTTVDDGYQFSGVADFGGNSFAGHLDAFIRESDDYDIPGDEGTQESTYVEQSGGAIGGSALFPNGHIGASVSFFASEYGLPGGHGHGEEDHDEDHDGDEEHEEEGHDVFIDMQQVRYQVGGRFGGLNGFFNEVSFAGGFTDYIHDEIEVEDGEIGATFDNEELEGRLEALHGAIGPFTGAVGIQGRTRDLTAAGEAGELLAPSETRALGAFLFEEADVGNGATFQMAGRIEHVEIDGTGFRPIGMGIEFPASRDFTPVSGSAGLIFDLGSDMYLSGTVQITQRAPDVLELFAKGPHEATETFEIGDPDLDIETARSFEATLERIDGPVRFSLAAYYTSFADFIYKDFTGIECGEDFDSCGVEDELTQIVYSQEDADFIGFEASAEFDVATLDNGGVITLDGMADYVRAELDSGGNVPRIPPFRVGGGVTYEHERVTVGTSLLHVTEQDDVGAFETPTDGYTDLRARLIYRFQMPNTDTPFEVGVVASNLLDEEMRNHSSFKKDEVLLPGRNFRLFVRARF